MNESIKNECIEICKKYDIDIDFNDEDWEEEFIGKNCWETVSLFEKLSNEFIEYFQTWVNWYSLLQTKKLPNKIIEKYINKFSFNTIKYLYKTKRFSKEIIEKYNIQIPENYWYYKDDYYKLKFIQEKTDYQILEDENGKYILAYKAVKKNGESFYNPDKYKYIVGQTYESECDCDIYFRSSYGLAAWNKENAIKFGIEFLKENFKIILVKIYIEDIGAIIEDRNNKIRCFKFTVECIVET